MLSRQSTERQVEKNETQIRFIPAQINDILLIWQKMTGAGCGHGNGKFEWCPATRKRAHAKLCVFCWCATRCH